MTSRNDIEWLEKLAEWQGSINATIRDIIKSQDELECQARNLQTSHTQCREGMLTTLAELKVMARTVGKRWGIIYGIVAGVITSVAAATIVLVITNFL